MIRNDMLVAFLVLAILTLSASAAEEGREEAGDAYRGPGSDLWIEAQLIAAYSLNELLNPLEIDVEAEQGTLTLSGKVENQAEKDLAVRIAEGLDGVSQVRDETKIGSGSTGGTGENPLFRYVNDANITARIQMRLLWNETTEGLNIDVDTKNGAVSLAGAVHSEEERQTAAQIARRTEGVTEVRSDLKVASGETLSHEARKAALEAGREISDAWINATVAASLSFDTTINHGAVDVETENGIVTLKGRVPTLLQKQGAGEIARGTSGVREVDIRGADTVGGG
jgi:osmotically-inducible protein OsmY